MNQLLTFTFIAPRIPIGQISLGVYDSSDINLTYRGECINTADSVNFIEANCTTNSGIWLDDGTEQYCSSIAEATDCIGSTSPQLGGTLKPEISLTVLPKTSFPIIYW
jgi:hypothetical protein